MKPPRGLTAQEAELWARVTATVRPLDSRTPPGPAQAGAPPAGQPGSPPRCAPPPATGATAPPPRADRVQTGSRTPRSPLSGGLDGHWERRIRGGGLHPDLTLDLHGTTLDGAYHRLNDGLAQARAIGARVVLLIAGKPRPVEAADRGTRRGAIRAKVLDWLAAGPHAGSIAAIRRAHPRHGGEGALYLVLRRGR
ncbi:DNA mismatch repair protein MutS [Erythrobacteraceae bacterium CFH 75059]|uniref:Smr/MutS family protein n=1 Tax=Qipengyuania thermophila TaxID=2509361 RepID=UPI00101F8998|nr:Smr/MutS family protein [Qipengyuania thermophila]TCD01905.1 DNA mismatch repair protein MutS [Erythrobacteraceae bacterium CFH 75059]